MGVKLCMICCNIGILFSLFCSPTHTECRMNLTLYRLINSLNKKSYKVTEYEMVESKVHFAFLEHGW